MANATVVLEQLIERCAAGDASALELLYKNTAAQLFGVLRRILVRQDLAQEALQDVYVSIWRNAKSIDRTRLPRLRGWSASRVIVRSTSNAAANARCTSRIRSSTFRKTRA